MYSIGNGEKEMNMKYIGGILCVAIIISLTAIFFTLNQSNVSDENEQDLDISGNIIFGNETLFHESANGFAFELLRQFKNNPTYSENPFFSPYSIFTALAMTYEGAVEKTADEMAAVLHIQQDNESFHHYVNALYHFLNNTSEYNISTANAAWIKQNYSILDQYLNTIEDFYNAHAAYIDFSNPETAADIINRWVENETNDLIHELLTSDDIDPVLTRLILTNAIYFKSTWKVQFDRENTTNRPFTLLSGETIDVSTMSLIETEDAFNYTETEEFQMLELPYTGNDLSMIILLPKEDDELSILVDSITEESYTQWLESMTEEEVDIYLPKFNITTPQYSLKDMLWNLGIHDAFTFDADLSGISGFKDLYIKDVFHKGFIEINEEGTEAAAATAVVIYLKSNGGGHSRIVFNCDHPFLYLIQHKETGTILFMGTMNNPIQ